MLSTVTRQVHRETSLKLPGYQTAALEPAVVVVDVFVVLVFVVVVVVVEGAEKAEQAFRVLLKGLTKPG